MSEMIKIPSKDKGTFNAYVAMPETLPAPVIIVIQEIFGINHVMRDLCDHYAEQGYIAVCPDLFWRLEPGVDITDKTEEEWAKAFDLFSRFDIDKGIEDLRATLHTFRGHAHSTAKIGCIGYCLGGKLAYLMACRSDIDASVGYYGVDIDSFLDESENIQHPLMLHIAEEDEYVSKDAQKKIKDTLRGNEKVTINSYPGMDHAFARVGGAHYDEDAANLANGRTAAFLKQYLNET